ncbi:hypothetical protein U1Q18_015736 [Sarracenia purpurea var. burkii]
MVVPKAGVEGLVPYHRPRGPRGKRQRLDGPRCGGCCDSWSMLGKILGAVCIMHPGHLTQHGFKEGKGGICVESIEEAQGGATKFILVVEGVSIAVEDSVGEPQWSH